MLVPLTVSIVIELYRHCTVVWDVLAEHVHAGSTAQVSIDHIYEVHGQNQGVTQIIN